MPRSKKTAISRRQQLQKARASKGVESDSSISETPEQPTTQVQPPTTPVQPPLQPTTTFQTPKDTSTPLSRFQKKLVLKDSSDKTRPESASTSAYDDAPSTSRCIVDLDVIFETIKALSCPSCNNSDLQPSINVSKSRGAIKCIQIYCPICDEIIHECMTSKDVNAASTLASLLSGMGSYRYDQYCTLLDIPSMHHKTSQM